jgi:hypothetical protein
MSTQESMATSQENFPPIPEIGRPDPYYMRAIADADQAGDTHLRAALKVARYISLAISPKLPWEEKQRYFAHALKHHCLAPSQDESTRQYYQQLADLVRQYAGSEALRLASQEDDMWAARAALGQDRNQIEDDAEAFFGRILGQGDHCPDHFADGDWAQLKLIRDQWI